MSHNSKDVEPASALQGLRVLVTRPVHQAESLCTLLAEAGALPIQFPTLEIVTIAEETLAAKVRHALADTTCAIFTSKNSVTPFDSSALLKAWAASSLNFLAVGNATKRALEQQGLQPVLSPPKNHENSEGLLTLPELQADAVRGKKIALFKGEGGLTLLETTLRERGAQVEPVDVYRRVIPTFNPAAHVWLAEGLIDVVICTSGEALRNLFTMLSECSWLTD
ncbi:MAG: uroporphyrinogen-III synthase [Pseudomonadota bacterium]